MIYDISKKRRRKHVGSIVGFFENDTKDGLKVLNGLSDPFGELSPQEALQIIRLYNKDRRAFEAFAAYARRYKKVSMEITEEDLAQARDFLVVKQTMES